MAGALPPDYTRKTWNVLRDEKNEQQAQREKTVRIGKSLKRQHKSHKIGDEVSSGVTGLPRTTQMYATSAIFVCFQPNLHIMNSTSVQIKPQSRVSLNGKEILSSLPLRRHNSLFSMPILRS